MDASAPSCSLNPTEARLDSLEAVEAALAHLVEHALFRDEPPPPET